MLKELLGLGDHLLEGLKQVLEEPSDRLGAAIVPGYCSVRRLELELGMRETICSIQSPRLNASYPTRSVSISACDIVRPVSRYGHRGRGGRFDPERGWTPRAGFEPAAYSLGGSRSIQLSYRGSCSDAGLFSQAPKTALLNGTFMEHMRARCH